MTFIACGIIFDTMFLKSDPENVFTDHNTQMAIMIALEPYKKITHRFRKNKAFYFMNFSQTIAHVGSHVGFYIYDPNIYRSAVICIKNVTTGACTIQHETLNDFYE